MYSSSAYGIGYRFGLVSESSNDNSINESTTTSASNISNTVQNLLGDGRSTKAINANNSDQKISRDKKSLLPLTIKQLNKFTVTVNGDTIIDGVKVWLVCVMGYVNVVTEDANSMKIVINDGSDCIDATIWKDIHNEVFQECNSSNNTFVRIIGELREENTSKTLQVHHVTRLNDWNELSYHLMDIVYVHIENKSNN